MKRHKLLTCCLECVLVQNLRVTKIFKLIQFTFLKLEHTERNLMCYKNGICIHKTLNLLVIVAYLNIDYNRPS